MLTENIYLNLKYKSKRKEDILYYYKMEHKKSGFLVLQLSL